MAKVERADNGAGGLSGLLDGIVLSGACWCYADLGLGGGFSVPGGEAASIHAVLHGALRLTAPSGGTIELKAGDAVCLLSGEAHALRLSAEAAAPVHEMLRDGKVADVPPATAFGQAGVPLARVLSGRLALTLPAGASRAGLPAFYRLTGHGLLADDALARAGIGAGASALLTRLATLMLTATLRADPACRRLFAPKRQDPIAEAQRLIAGNPSANWTVERLARSVGMGRSNFAAHFTAQVGRAPMELVAEARMDHAADLLRHGTLKVAEIAELSGYGSEAAFSRRFSRHFGQSPSQAREASRNESVAVEEPSPWRPMLAQPRQPATAAPVRERAQPAMGGAAVSRTILRKGLD